MGGVLNGAVKHDQRAGPCDWPVQQSMRQMCKIQSFAGSSCPEAGEVRHPRHGVNQTPSLKLVRLHM